MNKPIWLYGRHAVSAALAAKRRPVLELWCTKKNQDEVRALPGAAKAKLHIKDPQNFNAKFKDGVHQHIAALVGPLPELGLDDVAEASDLLLILDQVTDPHNLGAILRSAAAFGAGAVLVPSHGSVQLTPAALKAAAGAAEIVPVITVGNLNQTLKDLQEYSYWSVGLAGGSDLPLANLNLKGSKIALVMGSEGKGLRPLVAKNCDHIAQIPMVGDMESLNVSVAAGIALYQVRQCITS